MTLIDWIVLCLTTFTIVGYGIWKTRGSKIKPPHSVSFWPFKVAKTVYKLGFVHVCLVFEQDEIHDIRFLQPLKLKDFHGVIGFWE